MTFLRLNDNSINTDGCRGIAKLLQGGDATLSNLYLYGNKIDDNGVGILVDAPTKQQLTDDIEFIGE